MQDLLRLLRLFKLYTRWLSAGIVLSSGVILANVALLALSGWFITAMAIAGLGAGTINYFTAAAGIRGLAIVRTVGRYGERLINHDATLRLLSQLRVWFYDHLEPLAPARLQFYRGGDLLSRIRADIDALDNFYLRVLAPSIAAALSVVLMTGFIALFSWKIALFDLAGLLLAGIALPQLVQRLGRVPGERTVTRRAELRSGIADAVRGLGELRVYQASARQAAHIHRLSHNLIAPQRRQAHIHGLGAALSGLTNRLCMWAAVVIAIPLVTSHSLQGPDLAMIALFVLAGFEAISTLPLAFQSLGETMTVAHRLFEIVDTAPAITEPTAEAAYPRTFDLRISALRMRYPGSAAWALDGIDLAVPVGGRLGVVGPTGSGKTSILNVLLRFWDYQEGAIEIGGIPLNEFRGETARRWCAVVAQHNHLFNTSIRRNLLLARPEAGHEELIRVLHQANIHEEIEALPKGIDTVVGETGTRLSGGQARRIAIARALLKNAPVLLLDEPTEGLDAGAEHAVLQALESLMQDRTTVFVTHRPQALRYLSHVVVLSRGRILEQGSPETLLRDGRYLPIYARLN